MGPSDRTPPSSPDRRDAGRVVLVCTPIGNLDDLSPRAVATLATADVIACEDTRRTGRLLAHAGVDAELLSYHDHNERARAAQLVQRAAAGQTVAVVSDAGTPGVADPGLALVQAAVARDVPVEVVPGPAAFVVALVASGFPTDRFVFEGFLPRKQGARRRRLAELAGEPRTLVWYVAPHRAAEELADAAAAFGDDRPAVLARELTKRHEELRRGTLATLAAHASNAAPRGELTLVVRGAPPAEAPALDDLVAEAFARIDAGASTRQAVDEVAAAHPVRRRELYEAVLHADD